MSETGKLFHLDDNATNLEMSRLYSFVAEGLADADNLDLKSIAKKMPGLFGTRVLDPKSVDDLGEILYTTVSFTLSGEVANVRRITAQILDAHNNNIGQKIVFCWLSDNGQIAPVQPTSFTVITGTQLGQFGSNLSLMMFTDSTGTISIDVEEASAQDRDFHVFAGDLHRTQRMLYI